MMFNVPRQAAFAFVFVTVLLDMLALGMIIPVLPKLVVDFLGGDTARAAQIFGVFGTAWALMQFVFSPVQGALSDRYGPRPFAVTGPLLAAVSLIGLSTLRCEADSFGKIGVMLRYHVDHVGGHPVGRAQLELTADVVRHIDRAGLGAGKLRRPGDNGIEHGLQVECRVDCLRHRAKRAQLFN